MSHWVTLTRLAIQRNFKKQIAEPVELALNKPSPTMWDQILSAFKEALSKAEAQYMRKAKSKFFDGVCSFFLMIL